MAAIPASELAQIQSDLAAVVCDKPCEIWRAPLTNDGMGSPARGTYVKIAPVSPATLFVGLTQPSAGELANYAFRIESLAAWHVNLPWGTDVQVDDHLVVESNTLHVHVILDPHSIPGLLPVLAAELKP